MRDKRKKNEKQRYTKHMEDKAIERMIEDIRHMTADGAISQAKQRKMDKMDDYDEHRLIEEAGGFLDDTACINYLGIDPDRIRDEEKGFNNGGEQIEVKGLYAYDWDANIWKLKA